METRVPNVARGGGAEVAPQPRHSAGDPILRDCTVIEVHVAELNQRFNAIDPAPFRQRDLDPNAEDFIVGWAREMPADAPLVLDVHLDRPAGLPEERYSPRRIREFFGQRAQVARRRLRELFRRGRTGLAIGITFLAGSLLLGDIISRLLGERRVSEILRESLLIGGWVAMWRPMEVFLYDGVRSDLMPDSPIDSVLCPLKFLTQRTQAPNRGVRIGQLRRPPSSRWPPPNNDLKRAKG